MAKHWADLPPSLRMHSRGPGAQTVECCQSVSGPHSRHGPARVVVLTHTCCTTSEDSDSTRTLLAGGSMPRSSFTLASAAPSATSSALLQRGSMDWLLTSADVTACGGVAALMSFPEHADALCSGHLHR